MISQYYVVCVIIFLKNISGCGVYVSPFRVALSLPQKGVFHGRLLLEDQGQNAGIEGIQDQCCIWLLINACDGAQVVNSNL